MKFIFGRISVRDEQTHLTDGQWDTWEFVLGKGYYEFVFMRPPIEGHELPPVKLLKRRRFQIIKRKAEHACRIELLIDKRRNPVLCRFFMVQGKKRRERGYWAEVDGRLGMVVHPALGGKVINLSTLGKVAIWRKQ